MYDMTTYDAFFDELGLIEKRAMLKEAAVNPRGFFGGLGEGISRIWRKGLTPALQRAGQNFNIGSRGAAAGQGALGAGLGRVWRTPSGKALILGAAAVPVAAGVGGYALGQHSGEHRAMRP